MSATSSLHIRARRGAPMFRRWASSQSWGTATPAWDAAPWSRSPRGGPCPCGTAPRRHGLARAEPSWSFHLHRRRQDPAVAGPEAAAPARAASRRRRTLEQPQAGREPSPVAAGRRRVARLASCLGHVCVDFRLGPLGGIGGHWPFSLIQRLLI